MQTFDDLQQLAFQNLTSRNLNGVYKQRLDFELYEIRKQGAEAYWVNLYNKQKKLTKNPNFLVLPWLLDIVDSDPIIERSNIPMLCSTKAKDVKTFREQHGFIPLDIIKDADMPDIDLDCLPEARDHIKKYAIERYNKESDDKYGSVCSVGTWQTYKFKSAIIDVAMALGAVKDRYEIEKFTTELPLDVDELKEGGFAKCTGKIKNDIGEEKECGKIHDGIRCPSCESTETDSPTLGKLISENPSLNELYKIHKIVVDDAVRLIGCVRNMGMHAGALIIADRTLYGNIPLAKTSIGGQWVSLWSEGRNTQLSKLGYTKWDILGLKTLSHINHCCKLIKENRGISFGENMSGWEDINPVERKRGHFFDGNGKKRIINLDDKETLKLLNDLKTSTIFQFDTPLATQTLSNGVKNFDDLMLLNAMGHPGPLQSIPDVVKNRDDKKGLWKKELHPEFLKILESTYGYICYQEDLQQLWQNIAGFTSVEAQEARKAVAKKWVEKLKPVEEKWIKGATPKIGIDAAKEWWRKMHTFGRYAFNKSHAVSYCLVTIQAAWLKTHFAPEWWSSVLSDCHPDKLARFMGTARSEGWEPTDITYCGRIPKTKATNLQFGSININNLTTNFTVTDDIINQGLIGIKNIGESAAEIFTGKGNYQTIEEFLDGPNGKGLEEGRKNKIVLERFIKLGSFKNLPGHENSKALWAWYQYSYCSGKEITELRKTIKEALLKQEGWNNQTINQERKRQTEAYQNQYPKRNKIPPKITNWIPKPNDSRERIMALYTEDFTISERLMFQKQFLGYYLDSPLELYEITGGCSIEEAKRDGIKGDDVKLEVIIAQINEGITAKGSPFLKIIVDDGLQKALVLMWSNELAAQDFSVMQEGVGISVIVNYSQSRNSFSVIRGESVRKLKPK